MARAFAVNQVRDDFPILQAKPYGKPLAYLDSAATTQRPSCVINAISDYYLHQNSNVHRGVHYLSQLATTSYEQAREKVKNFINAASIKECIFTRGTTESINLVANSFGDAYLQAGDEILISGLEHHSNIVPWQLLCERKQSVLKIIPILESGEIDISQLDNLITNKTKLISINYCSNSLGTVNPVREIIQAARAKSKDIKILIDAAQAMAHTVVDVQELDCDFLAFSGHKMYAPMSIGVLYGKQEILNNMPPFLGGGDMILEVSFDKTTYNDLPYKFEAGTPSVPEAIALGAAIDYLSSFSRDELQQHENMLLEYATAQLQNVSGLRLIGTAANKISLVSFIIDKVHPHDIGTILDTAGIAVRAGHHCTQPVMEFFKIPATTRASFGIYNTVAEIDILVEQLQKISKMFNKKRR